VRTLKRNKLGRQDWIAAGTEVLMEGGIQAVQVEPLARRLGVTKGSFYWHFRDAADLTSSMLDKWEMESTEAVIAEAEAAGGDARSQLLRLMKRVLERDSRLDLAIRAWAAVDARTAARLEAVDRRRLAYLHRLFIEMGFDEAATKARSRLVYNGMIGEYQVRPKLSQKERLVAAEVNHAMLTR
jgi:AcrR family transcriptional regulator